jgi:RHS repeat-associated protein
MSSPTPQRVSGITAWAASARRRATPLALLLVAAVPALAEDKSGVSPQRIAVPSGPGSLEGLGDAFQPSLNDGTAKYGVVFQLPAGTAGFTPTLGLSYDSGKGFGLAGFGWSLKPPCIRRQSAKGMPRYGDAPDGVTTPDRFLGPDGEELVPLENGYYLAKVEGLFVRYRFVNDHWEARTKSGVRLEFGLTQDARVVSPDATRVFAWCLERQSDLHGNTIEYEYVRPSAEDAQIYLTAIHYGPGPAPWTHAYHVALTYEDRPDAFSDCRPGFALRTTRRLARVDILYDTSLIRRYVLEYAADVPWSYLSRLTPYGSDGVTALPATTFTYELFTLPPPGDPVAVDAAILESSPNLVDSVDAANADLIDLNNDALPDVLVTGTTHFAYINRGVRIEQGVRRIEWEGPVQVAAAEQRTYNLKLSAANVHLADMTGDGIADLVVTHGEGSGGYVEYFPNSGALGWGRGAVMSSESRSPPAPFGNSRASVRTSDLTLNRRIDIMQSQSGAVVCWFHQGNGIYTGPIITEGVRDGSRYVELSDTGVDLADVNGDSLQDWAQIRTDAILYWPSLGYGRFGARTRIPLPDRSLDDRPDGNIHRAKLVDVNGDGLADVVVERARGDELWLWLNRGDGTLETSRVIIGLPVTPEAEAQWADINGNGSTDLLYADSNLPGSRLNAVDLAEAIGGATHYNLLTEAANGYGRTTKIAYRATTDYSVAAWRDGHAWATSVPFPSNVVSHTETTFGLDLDGYPDEGPTGDVYTSDILYRDGYYEAIEGQFRGFAFVKQTTPGDERFGGGDAPTLVERYAFHTGAPDGIDNDGDGETDEEGDLWTGREEEPLKGVQLWLEKTALPDDPSRDGEYADAAVVFERVIGQWNIRNLATDTGGLIPARLGDGYRTSDAYHRDVRQATQSATERVIIERGQGEPRTLRASLEYDPFGNKTSETNEGAVGSTGDEIYTAAEHAVNETLWIVDRPTRTYQTDGGAGGAFVSETRTYYDGNPYEGLPLGEIGDRALPHRSQAIISGGPVPDITERSLLRGDPRDPSGVVDVLRQEFDAWGNPIELRDANGGRWRFEFDADLRKFVTREIIEVGEGRPDLLTSATYDARFDQPLTVTGFDGHTTSLTFDVFGRLTEIYVPGDPAGQPTSTYAYDLSNPISSITTTAHDNVAGAPDVIGRVFFDGLGRKLGTYTPGGPVMTEVTLYNPRGLPRKVFLPYEGGDGTWSPPPDTNPAVTTRYDAAGRGIETASPPDAGGIQAATRLEFEPLLVREYDAEDTRPGGMHEDTPKTLVSDGLGRLIEVREIERLSGIDPGEFITKYRYVLPDLLGEIEDANGNIKYMRYDGLGRMIFMNDLNRGHLTYTYDAVGNLLSRVDAMGQEIVHAYDVANRITSIDYLDDGHPLSLNRTPDVAYHYDGASPDHPELDNTAGRLSWIVDLTGGEFYGYNDRGQPEALIKRVDEIDGSLTEYATRSLSDNLGRVYQFVYPDGDVVRFGMNARGLLDAIPGLVTALNYEPSGQTRALHLANGVSRSYVYDPRNRLTDLVTQSGGDLFQNLTYTYDQVGNILGIEDLRGLPGGDPRDQTGAFAVDDLYRLRSAVGVGYGTIEYDYDRLGNMATKTSPDIDDPDVNIGVMESGGSGGTRDRVGRGPGDPPGPHAITRGDNGVDVRTFAYDDNGNMTANGGDGYVYDFADRLGRVVKDGRDIRYLYDHTGRRVIKRVDGEQTTYVSGACEVRDDEFLKYVSGGMGRLARTSGGLPQTGEVVQIIDLYAGGNLVSFQVAPGTTDPAELLAELEPSLQAAYGYNGTDYEFFIPGRQDSTLTEMQPLVGYWLLMSDAAELRVSGPLSTGEVTIAADTPTLVGLPGLTARGLGDLLFEYPAVVEIWAYSGRDQDWTFHARGPPYADTLTEVRSGAGYWIVADEAVTLTLPAAGPLYYYHGDHLGSTNVVTDGAGLLTHESYNYPFGSLRHEHNPGADFDPYYQFTGKEKDDESGLQYFEARMMANPIGRFLSVDPLREAGSNSHLARSTWVHAYAYALSNPMIVTDDSGMVPQVRETADAYIWSDEIIIWGSEKATDEVAAHIQKTINDVWNRKSFQYDGKPVRFEVSVRAVAYGSDAAETAYPFKEPEGTEYIVRIPDDLENRTGAHVMEIQQPTPEYLEAERKVPGAVYLKSNNPVNDRTPADQSPLIPRYGFLTAERGVGSTAASELGHLWGLQHRNDQSGSIMCHVPECATFRAVDQAIVTDLLTNYLKASGTAPPTGAVVNTKNGLLRRTQKND